MNQRLLEILGCPYDRSGLRESGDALTCAVCARVFPVRDGIPRLLPDALDALTLRTQRSFGYQWTRFQDRPDPLWEGYFAEYVHPLTPSDFKGRRVLDAGCGNGRFLRLAREYGADAVGLDLSAAVGPAARLSGAPVVQGSLLLPPFRGRFDLIYSIGVLHHLPEGTGAGVEVLAGLLAPGGLLSVWVYSTRRLEEKRLRRWAARMPLPLLRLAALALAARIRLRGFRGWEPYRTCPFKVLWTDVFDMLAPPVERQHSAEEVSAWIRAAGLEVLHLSHIDASQGWRVLGRKPA